jgi:hypothetical protein
MLYTNESGLLGVTTGDRSLFTFDCDVGGEPFALNYDILLFTDEFVRFQVLTPATAG